MPVDLHWGHEGGTGGSQGGGGGGVGRAKEPTAVAAHPGELVMEGRWVGCDSSGSGAL